MMVSRYPVRYLVDRIQPILLHSELAQLVKRDKSHDRVRNDGADL